MKPVFCLSVLLLPTVVMGSDCRVVQQRVVSKQVYAYQLQQVYPAAYFSVGAAVAEEALAQRIAQRVEQLLFQEEEPEQEELFGRRKKRRNPPQEPPVTEPELPAEPESPVQAMFDAKCLKCHQGEKAKAGLDLTDATLLTKCQARMIYFETNLGHMPQKGEPLTDAEMLLITEWIEDRKTNEGD